MSGLDFSMGRYAAFVWPSVLLVLAILAWNVWSARQRLNQALLRAQRAQQMRQEQS